MQNLLAHDMRFGSKGIVSRHWLLERALVVAVALVGVALALPARADLGDEECGSLENAFGPFDYRSPPPGALSVVESHHFTPKVENLSSGQEGYLEGDISYTLRAFPNHHRALLAMAKLFLKHKTRKYGLSPYTIECWFSRAIQFREDDAQVRVVYGYYLSRRGDPSGAAEQFREAIRLGADTGNVHYNLGLVLLDLKDVSGAMQHAARAEELGFKLPGLRRRLQAAGQPAK